MKKSISISIRVSEEELDKFKQAAKLEAYASYSEFVRRTALIEASRIIKENNVEGEKMDECNYKRNEETKRRIKERRKQSRNENKEKSNNRSL